MYTLQPNSIVQLTFEGLHDGQRTITVMSYINDTLTPVADGQAQVASFLSSVMGVGGLYESYQACCSVDVKNIRAYGQVIELNRYAYIQAMGDGGDGAALGACMPANTAQVVTRRGELADRRNISTLHLPGVPISAVADSFLTDPQIAILQSFVDVSLLPIITVGGAELNPCAFRRADPVGSRHLTMGFVQNTVRILRRRTVGVGV